MSKQEPRGPGRARDRRGEGEGHRSAEVPPEGERDGGCRPALPDAPLDPDQAARLAQMFKALGDPVRLRLLSMIASRAGGEVCVCELTPAFDLSKPTISHHLKLLRQAGLIDCERRGTWVYYRLVPEMADRLTGVLSPFPRAPEEAAAGRPLPAHARAAS